MKKKEEEMQNQEKELLVCNLNDIIYKNKDYFFAYSNKTKQIEKIYILITKVKDSILDIFFLCKAELYSACTNNTMLKNEEFKDYKTLYRYRFYGKNDVAVSVKIIEHYLKISILYLDKISNSMSGFIYVESTYNTVYNETIKTMAYKFVIFKFNKSTNKYVQSTSIKLFNKKPHPDCCGALLLYGFPTELLLYKSTSRFYKFYNNKERLEQLKKAIKPWVGKIAHLSHKQTMAIDFVTKLGFEEVNTYKNTNSGNKILVFIK